MKLSTLILSAVVMTTVACVPKVSADQVLGYVTSTQLEYRTNAVQYISPVCHNVQVPVYSVQPSRPGDVLAGAVIGGVIGNQFGHGNGRDAATILGAILGADLASRGSSQIIGYQNQTECVNRVHTQNQTVQDGYRVFYTVNGMMHSFHTYQWYSAGDVIIIQR